MVETGENGRALPLPREVALGTMHGKEAILAPPLAELGIGLRVADIDTDRFGTFTAETPRAGDMLQAARAKARAAIAATGLPVGMASEGAYGPHPAVPFVALGRELLLWHDARNGQELVEWATDRAPRHDHHEVADLTEAAGFLSRVGFPQTAVIVAPGAALPPVAKGLRDAAGLERAVAEAVRVAGRAFLQTDMRAHMNPRRMEVIGRLAEAFARRLATPCGGCGAPGFGLIRSAPGLPCRDCGTPTGEIGDDICGCSLCGVETVRPRAELADPAHCPICNP